GAALKREVCRFRPGRPGGEEQPGHQDSEPPSHARWDPRRSSIRDAFKLARLPASLRQIRRARPRAPPFLGRPFAGSGDQTLTGGTHRMTTKRLWLCAAMLPASLLLGACAEDSASRSTAATQAPNTGPTGQEGAAAPKTSDSKPATDPNAPA